MTIVNFKKVKVNSRGLFKESPKCFSLEIEAEESHEKHL